MNSVINAVLNLNVKDLSEILLRGEDPNISEEGMSAINWASTLFDTEKIGLLIKYGANVNSKDMDGVTALMKSSYLGNLAIVELLLNEGAIVNDLDDTGQSALMSASKAGCINIVKSLISYNAEVNLKDKNGLTALHWSTTEGDFPEIAEYLLQHDGNLYQKNNSGLSPIDYAKKLNRVRWIQVAIIGLGDTDNLIT